MEKNKASKQEGDLSLVGFEKVFVQIEQIAPTECSNDESNIHEQIQEIENIHEYAHELDSESFEMVTMAEAARRLKMPYPTLRRQVLAGKISSSPGPDGKPMVKMKIGEHPPEGNEQEKSSSEQNEFSSEYSLTVHSLLRQIENERGYSKSLNEKLEAANHRNGYLEAQVEAKVDHIKLLTDAQHKAPGWWSRFSFWFTGQRG